MGLHLIEVLVYSTSVLLFNTNTRTYGTTPDRSTSVFNQCVTLLILHLILGHMGLHLVYSTSVLLFNTNTRTYGTTPDRSTSVFNQCVTL